MDTRKVVFIGAGNMSRSIIGGLVQSGYPASAITATNPSQPKLDALQAQFGIRIGNDNRLACQQADVIVLAVKPQLMASVCSDLATLDLSQKLIITIAAGIPASRYQDFFAQPIQLVRTMPNTPSMLGLGLTGLYADAHVEQADRQFAGSLMAAVGEIVWFEHERGINQVIACAGSSPAYFFLFMEAMEQAAAKLGVADADARLMIQQAAVGAAQMVKANPELSLAQLRAQVTSKGGTTFEAVNTLEQHNLRDSVDAAMQAAVNRAEQMADQF
ncbi:pyrroline-5-carboxylate reductase [uncultured Ferrimonas sp.]|uniref:pyrroline-5-carboxylate reductase n=1 Tax=uncultured Ferrimonas sp. TaxID=432640 RepID=UPI0026389CFB|nr:pyrroline-5-carboxylate reductase [uncultured Ferrimonas sp.]